MFWAEMLCHAFLYQLLTVFGCDLVTQKRNNYYFFLGLYLRAKVSAALIGSQFYQHMLGNLWIERLLIILTRACVSIIKSLLFVQSAHHLPVCCWFCRSGYLWVTKAENNLSCISWAFSQSLRLNGWIGDWKNN